MAGLRFEYASVITIILNEIKNTFKLSFLWSFFNGQFYVSFYKSELHTHWGQIKQYSNKYISFNFMTDKHCFFCILCSLILYLFAGHSRANTMHPLNTIVSMANKDCEENLICTCWHIATVAAALYVLTLLQQWQ